MSPPVEPHDPSTGDADGPHGGGRGRYTWVIGLVAVIVALGVVALVVGGLGGDQNAPSR